MNKKSLLELLKDDQKYILQYSVHPELDFRGIVIYKDLEEGNYDTYLYFLVACDFEGKLFLGQDIRVPLKIITNLEIYTEDKENLKILRDQLKL